MLVLISPSKTQDFDTEPSIKTATVPTLLDDSVLLAAELKKLTRPALAKLMDISEKLATLNQKRFKTWHAPFTHDNAKQAIYAFRGDVYDGFDVDSMDREAVDFAQGHLRILSGIYGLLKPLDLIQPYRLEMKIKLKNPRGKDLYAFWGDRIADLLAAELPAHESKVVVNLASEEYFKAVNAKKLAAKIIAPQFKEKRGNTYKMIALFAKKARGSMARYICERGVTHPEALHFFAEDGYRFNTQLSKPGTPVYTRG